VQSAFGHAGQSAVRPASPSWLRDVYEDPAFLRQLIDAVRTLSRRPRLAALDVGWTDHSQRRTGARTRALSSRPRRELATRTSSTRRRGTAMESGSEAGRAFRFVESPTRVVRSPCLVSWLPRTSPTAIRWQNRTDFGLTAGLQSLDEVECELWMDRIQAGNLYVNRGITGAIVNRQPFGGWRRSSVGPTRKPVVTTTSTRCGVGRR